MLDPPTSPGVLCWCWVPLHGLLCCACVWPAIYSPWPWAPAICPTKRLSYRGVVRLCSPPALSAHPVCTGLSVATSLQLIVCSEPVLPMGAQSRRWAAPRVRRPDVHHLYIHARYVLRPPMRLPSGQRGAVRLWDVFVGTMIMTPVCYPHIPTWRCFLGVAESACAPPWVSPLLASLLRWLVDYVTLRDFWGVLDRNLLQFYGFAPNAVPGRF